MATDPRCPQTHAQIGWLGFCPWCRHWIYGGQPVEAGDAPALGGPARPKSPEQLKRIILQKLVDKLDPSRVHGLEADALRREVRLVVERICDSENPWLSRIERERLIDQVLNEVFGG